MPGPPCGPSSRSIPWYRDRERTYAIWDIMERPRPDRAELQGRALCPCATCDRRSRFRSEISWRVWVPLLGLLSLLGLLLAGVSLLAAFKVVPARVALRERAVVPPGRAVTAAAEVEAETQNEAPRVPRGLSQFFTGSRVTFSVENKAPASGPLQSPWWTNLALLRWTLDLTFPSSATGSQKATA
jgi:hypothetical protein